MESEEFNDVAGNDAHSITNKINVRETCSDDYPEQVIRYSESVAEPPQLQEFDDK